MDKLLKQALSEYEVNEPGQELIDKIVDNTWGRDNPVTVKPWFVLPMRSAAALCALYCGIALFAFEAGRTHLHENAGHSATAQIKEYRTFQSSEYRIIEAFLWGRADIQKILL